MDMSFCAPEGNGPQLMFTMTTGLHCLSSARPTFHGRAADEVQAIDGERLPCFVRSHGNGVLLLRRLIGYYQARVPPGRHGNVTSYASRIG